jgi:hypothetical protein
MAQTAAKEEITFPSDFHTCFKAFRLLQRSGKRRNNGFWQLDLFSNPVGYCGLKSVQVPRFFRLKPCKIAFFNGNCSITEVIEQLYYIAELELQTIKDLMRFLYLE